MVVLAAAGCGGSKAVSTSATGATSSSSTTSSTSASSTTTSTAGSSTSSVAKASTITTTMVNGKPHFGSPEDAMRYLADAWNRNDLVSLMHVTDPSARDQLNSMHGVATNLRLDHCTRTPAGDYNCYFDHDYPPHASTTMVMADMQTGHAMFLVGPADTPGWYMTVFERCS